MNNNMHKNITKNNGAVLVMSLLMLFVLTLIGVSAINTTTMEEKMSGNTRNRQIAFQSAETAVRAAELEITKNINNPVALFDGTGDPAGYYAIGKGPSTTDAVNSAWWSNTSNLRISYAGDLQKSSMAAPQYTIEYLGKTEQDDASGIVIQGGEENTGDPGGMHTFRITSRGTGLTSSAVVVIQSHFGK